MPDADEGPATVAGRPPRPLPVRAVLFDLDGTLADTAPDLGAAINRVRVTRGRAPLPLSRLRPFASHGARGLLRAAFSIGPDDADYPALREAFLSEYAAAVCVESRLFADVAALIDTIEARALKWGIVTNKATCYTRPLIEGLGLAGRAGTVVCGDTTAYAKPHPAPLLAAAAELEVDPASCVYVGDAERDIIAGVAAGMRTLIACYGYIEPQELPGTWPADGMLDTPAALLGWLPARASG